MGRAVLKIADSLVSVILAQGSITSVPEEPLRGVRVIDARFESSCIELLLSGDKLTGPDDAIFATAPAVNPMFRRAARLEGEALLQTIADLDRIAEENYAGSIDLQSGEIRCQLAVDAMKRIPGDLLLQARAYRRATAAKLENAAAAEPTDERRGEVPGA